MQFAKQVLICAAGDTLEPTLDQRALRFIAIVVLSFFVLLHYFSGRAGRDLNQILAFIKITLLVIVFFAGIARASHHYTADWGIAPNKDASSSAIAFLYIVFSFTGWENATFVRIVESPINKGTNCSDRSVVKLQTTKFSRRVLYGQYASLEFYTC
jgi:uncharacterized membrane protein